MKLTKEEQAELLSFLNHREIAQLIKDVQCCLWIDDISMERLKRKFVDIVVTIQRNQKLRLAPKINGGLASILREIVDASHCFSMHFIHDFALEYLQEFSQKISPDHPLDYSIWSALQIYASAAWSRIEARGNAQAHLFLKIPKEACDVLSAAEALAKTSRIYVSWYKNISFLAMSFCLAMFVEGRLAGRMNLEFELRNLVFFVFAAYLYSSLGARFVSYTLDLDAKKFKSEKDYSFLIEQVDILEGDKVIETTYLPFHTEAYHPVLERKDTKSAENESLSLAIGGRSKVKKRSRIESLFAPLYPPISSVNSVMWPSLSLLCGGEGVVAQRDVHAMRAPYFSHKNHYYGFFNQRALQNQGVDLQSAPLQQCKMRVENGNVVGPTGESGIKKLQPSMLIRPRIEGESLKQFLFRWSAKTVSTVDRLLGHEANIQLDSAGERHVLVDFGYYMAKGPGH
jgi:hypothetical protein